MPYKDKAKQKEAVKKAVLKHHKGITEKTILEGITGEGITYPPIIHALADPIKKKKLESICEHLDRRKLLSKVYYGAGEHSVDFEIVNDMLDAVGG